MKPYIIPFEELKNKDVDLVGGKNASIGEMISGLASLGVSVPGGFATTSHAYRDFLAQDGLDERIRSALASLDVDDVERLGGGRQGDPRLDAGHALSRAPQRRGACAWRKMGHGSEIRGGGALVGHRRGSARGILRRPAGNFSQRARRGSSLVQHARSVRIAVQRPGHLVSRAQQLRSQRGGAVGRRPAHGAQRSGRGRRDVHARHGLRISRRRLHHGGLRSRGDRGARSRQSR